jgi:hypothetical protein
VSISASHKGHETNEAKRGSGVEEQGLLEVLTLFSVHDDEEAVVVEGFDGARLLALDRLDVLAWHALSDLLADELLQGQGGGNPEAPRHLLAQAKLLEELNFYLLFFHTFSRLQGELS